jgi:dihydrofolate reductase
VIVSLIVAADENDGIGWRGEIPWHLRTDLQRFKALTMGHHILMGRKTYESIGRPLPGRHMVVITRNPDYQAESVHVVGSLEQALAFAHSRNEAEVFVIGGGEIFRQALPLVDRIYFTLVHTQACADVFFPQLDASEWLTSREETFPADEYNDYVHTFRILERK